MQDKIKLKIFTIESLLPENLDTNSNYNPKTSITGSEDKIYTQETLSQDSLSQLLTAQDLADGAVTNAKIREITADKIMAGIIRVGMYMESADYDLDAGTGWKISAGDNPGDPSYINIANGNFTGTINAGAIITGLIKMGGAGKDNGIIQMEHTAGRGDSAIRINKTMFNHNEVGAIMGIDDTDQRAKMYLDSAGDHFAFNGVNIETQGILIASTIFKMAIYQVSALPIPQAQVGYNNPSSIT